MLHLSDFSNFSKLIFVFTGTIVNDTIIGDPLFTVTLPQENEFMCYEVHGRAGKYFNLISDSCLSVNALFAQLPMNERINRMSEIGITAVNTDNECVDIKISIDGCSGELVGQGNITSTYQDKGISIRSYPRRWRVSVPNCASTQAVLWIFCDSMDMLRLHIARGNNLAVSSHGLLGKYVHSHLKTHMQNSATINEVFWLVVYTRSR